MIVTVYGKGPGECPFCDRAKVWLEANKVSFQMIDVTKNAEALKFIKDRGHNKVPQLYVGETLLVAGGYDGMTKLGIDALRERIEVFSQQAEKLANNTVGK